LAAVLFMSPPAAATVATASSAAAYSFDWQANPAAPATWTGQGGWDVLVHKRGGQDGATMLPTVAQHGGDCAPTPATHVITKLDEGVYVCHQHVMTSIVDAGFGAIVLTPDHMADFSSGETVIGFSTTTLHYNARDWIDIWVTPFSENVVAPLDDAVDLQGPPRDAVRVRMCECFNGQTTFSATVFSNFKGTDLPQASGQPIESAVTPSTVNRTPFELHLSQNHIKFGAPQQNLWWVDTNISLPWSRGVVQLMDHSYDSCKDQTVDAAHPCASGDTWHWSAFKISQATPFTILNGDIRYAGAQFSNNTVNFPAPAPSNAFLRFEGMGTNLQYSTDGGKSFQAVTRQAIIGDHGQIHDEHAAPFFTPIPAGTTSVVLRGQNAWYGPWLVRDPAIWASVYAGPVTQPPPPGTQPPATKPGEGPGGGPSGESPEKHLQPQTQHRQPAVQARGLDLTGAVRAALPVAPLALFVLLVFAGGLAVGFGWRRRTPKKRS
jgi:hypothetical protein